MQSRPMSYVVTCVVSCRVAKEGSRKLQGKWSDFLDDYPTVEELEGTEAVLRSEADGGESRQEQVVIGASAEDAEAAVSGVRYSYPKA